MGEDTPKSKRKRTPFEEREKQILCQIIKEVDVGVCPTVAALLLLDKERDLLVLEQICCGQQLLQRQLLHELRQCLSAPGRGLLNSGVGGAGDNHLPDVGVYYARGGG